MMDTRHRTLSSFIGWKWKNISMRKFSFRSRELPRFGKNLRVFPELLSQNNLSRGFTIAKKLIELQVVLYLYFIMSALPQNGNKTYIYGLCDSS